MLMSYGNAAPADYFAREESDKLIDFRSDFIT
jgi:hypothetical protein